MDKPSRCPRCGTALISARSRTAVMHGCTTCGGIWLDNFASRRVITGLCNDSLHKAEVLARFAQREADRAAKIACPVCAAPLVRWMIAEAKIEIDHCPQHGAWFDRDELATIARSYAERGKHDADEAGRPSGESVVEVGSIALVLRDPEDEEAARAAAARGDEDVFGRISVILSHTDS